MIYFAFLSVLTLAAFAMVAFVVLRMERTFSRTTESILGYLQERATEEEEEKKRTAKDFEKEAVDPAELRELTDEEMMQFLKPSATKTEPGVEE